MKIDWNIVSAVGTCLGAFATFCAVIVSLWQTQLKQRKSIKLSFSRSFLFDGLGNTIDGITLSVMNTGNRSITIEEWGFVMADNSVLSVIGNNLLSVGAKIPVTIEPDFSANFYLPLHTLANNFQQAINNNKLKENDCIKIFVRDNFSRRYYHNTKAKVKNFLQPIK